MSFSELLNDRDMYMLYLTAAALVVFAVMIVYSLFMTVFDGAVPSSRLAKLFFNRVGDGGKSQSQLSPDKRFFLSVLSIVSMFTALAGLLLGVLVLAGTFSDSTAKLYAAGAAGLIVAGVCGLYYGGSNRGWPH